MTRLAEHIVGRFDHVAAELLGQERVKFRGGRS